MNGLLVSLYSMMVLAFVLRITNAKHLFNPFLGEGRTRTITLAKQNKTKHVRDQFLSVLLRVPFDLHWMDLGVVLQLLFDTRNDSMRSLVEKKNRTRKESGWTTICLKIPCNDKLVSWMRKKTNTLTMSPRALILFVRLLVFFSSPFNSQTIFFDYIRSVYLSN